MRRANSRSESPCRRRRVLTSFSMWVAFGLGWGLSFTAMEVGTLEELDIMKPPEVCDMLHIGYTTLKGLLKRKEIPAFKVGGQWRFRRATLERWLMDSDASGIAKRLPHVSGPAGQKESPTDMKPPAEALPSDLLAKALRAVVDVVKEEIKEELRREMVSNS